MANYTCAFRTNYFAVKDKELFDKIVDIANIQGGDCKSYEKDGKYMIGGYGQPYIFGDPDIDFVKDLPEYENSFFTLLQKCVADDDAIIYKEAGWEALRYITHEAWVITSEVMNWINIDDMLIDTARELLENEDWTTTLTY